MNDVSLMTQAWELALKGWGKVSPNPMVGSVIVSKGKVISEGYHHYYGGDHAEVDALKKIKKIPSDAVLYVTLEPCCHWGKTPPCVEAIIHSGIKKVVVGCLDPNPLMRGKSVKLLRQQGIKVEVGVLSDELMRLNEVFNCYITHQRPFVTAKIAQTLDGKIATLTGESQWITSAASRDYARRYRYGFDAIMVGKNTVIKDNPRLTTQPVKAIKKIICDTHLQIALNSRIFMNTKPSDVLIYTAATLSGVQLKQWGKKATLIRTPLKEKQLDLSWVMKDLYHRQVAHVLIEGGAALITRAIKDRLIDKMMIYIAPKILGAGLSSVEDLKVNKLSRALTFDNGSFEKLGEDMLFTGYLKK